MKTYWYITRFRFLRFFAYPWEMISVILQNVITIGGLVLIWSVVFSDPGEGQTTKELLSYFLIANGISTITMSHMTQFGKFLRHSIRDGWFSSYLILPINELKYAYFSTIGTEGLRIALAIATIILGLMLQPPTLIGLVIFPLFFVAAMAIGISMNVLEGTIAFITVEATGFKNALRHTSRILSGKIIPLYLFPNGLRQVVEILPFAGMVFGPINAIYTERINSEVIVSLGVSVFWAIVLNILVLKFWSYSLKRYEAIGQ